MVKKGPRNGECCGVASLRLVVFQTGPREESAHIVFIAGAQPCNSSAKIIVDNISTMNVVKYSNKKIYWRCGKKGLGKPMCVSSSSYSSPNYLVVFSNCLHDGESSCETVSLSKCVYHVPY